MTWQETVIKLICVFCITMYPISVVYAYGRLNYIFNYIKEEVNYTTWTANRNKALITAIALNIIAAIYLVFRSDYGCHSRDRGLLNFALYKRKEDPLYHQMAEEEPNSFWDGKHAMRNQMKRRWKEL